MRTTMHLIALAVLYSVARFVTDETEGSACVLALPAARKSWYEHLVPVVRYIVRVSYLYL
jgi:hypothetical protein